MKVLFICLGNIARSQIAEAYYNHFTNSGDASSAAAKDFIPQSYMHPVKGAIEVMNEERIDISNNLVKTVTPELIKDAEKIIVLCKREECPHFVLEKNPEFWKIEDPFGFNLDNYRKVRNQIKEKVKRLI